MRRLGKRLAYNFKTANFQAGYSFLFSAQGHATVDYDPLTHPFELPVQCLRIDCAAEKPLLFQPNADSTPGTTLWGAFGDALLRGVCQRRADRACGDGAGGCAAPDACAGRWLYKPHSTTQKRELPRPVLLYAPALESGRPCAEFHIELVLWGRQAIARREAVEHLVRQMGRQGLKTGPAAAEPTRFLATRIEAGPVATLAKRIEAVWAWRGRGFLLRFETPFLLQKNQRLANAEEVALADILGACAYELAAWDIEDRGLGEELPKPPHKLCLDARDAARQSAASARLAHWLPHHSAQANRVSRKNGHRFPLQGFMGEARFSAIDGDALPWLVVLALGGGGQKRPWGFGRVGIGWDAD
jgi:hypothetical protein